VEVEKMLDRLKFTWRITCFADYGAVSVVVAVFSIRAFTKFGALWRYINDHQKKTYTNFTKKYQHQFPFCFWERIERLKAKK
jgi:uncharacterized membrane protein YqhA